MRVLNIVSLLTFFSTSVHLNHYFQRVPSQAIDSTVKVISKLKKCGHYVVDIVFFFENYVVDIVIQFCITSINYLYQICIRRNRSQKHSGNRRNTVQIFYCLVLTFSLSTLSTISRFGTAAEKEKDGLRASNAVSDNICWQKYVFLSR